jgi:hypothetical protein
MATKKKPAKKPAAKKPAAKKPAAKKPAAKKPTAKKTAPEKTVAKPKPKAGIDAHPGYALLSSKLKPGRYAGGMLFVTKLGEHDDEMGPWLMGKTEGRRAIGRTAFGDIVVFRDLSGRAKELGLPDPHTACDVAMIDIHYKRMTMLADSAKSFLDSLEKPDWQKAFLRADLYRKAKKRLGDYGDDECFCFVLALAMGGSEDAASVQRANWRVHQDILRQT